MRTFVVVQLLFTVHISRYSGAGGGAAIPLRMKKKTKRATLHVLASWAHREWDTPAATETVPTNKAVT
jgi:hypothetical protein